MSELIIERPEHGYAVWKNKDGDIICDWYNDANINFPEDLTSYRDIGDLVSVVYRKGFSDGSIQLKQQLESFKNLAETNKKLGDKYFEQLKDAVEVIEIAQKRIKENPDHLVITQGDLINNKWHERTRQFLAKYRGEK